MLKLVFNILRSAFRWARRSVLLIGFIFLLTTNVLTLTSGLVQSALSASLGLLGISTVYGALDSTVRNKNNKINAQQKEIVKQQAANRKLSKDFKSERAHSKSLENSIAKKDTRIKKLSSGNKTLVSKGNKLAGITNDLTSAHKDLKLSTGVKNSAIRSIGGRVTSRTMKSAALNVTSIPFESIPIVGIGVIAVVTLSELHMTCDNISDMNEIYAAMGIQPEEDLGKVESTCLGYIDLVESKIDAASETVDMSRVNEVVDNILAKVGIGDEP